MERDDFTCKKCGDVESTLHVHHKFYVFGREPWEYENDELITLCWECHEEEGWDKESFMGFVHMCLKEGLTYGNLAQYMSGIAPPLEGISVDDRVRYGSFCSGNLEILLSTKDMIDKIPYPF